MKKTFDDILKKGKNVAGASDPEQEWKDCINILMHEIHRLNQMYSDDYKHHVSIEQSKCDRCGKASFLICVHDYNDHSRAKKYYKGDWQPVGDSKYHCDNCKGK